MSSPPMELDDPGTPGPLGIEVNLVGTFERRGGGRGSETLLDVNYGIGERLQLKLERPYLTENAPGTRFQQGLGATEVGLKWRVLDHGGLAVAAYPQFGFDDAFRAENEEGAVETGEGRSLYLPLLISQSVGRVSTLAINVGYKRNLDDRGDDINLALGAGRAVGADSRILLEVFSERNERLRNRQTDVRVGFAGVLLSKATLELGGFVSIGHSLGTTEAGERSTSFVLGLGFLRKPSPKGASHDIAFTSSGSSLGAPR